MPTISIIIIDMPTVTCRPCPSPREPFSWRLASHRGRHASREERGIASGTECGNVCWAPTSLGESFRYYSFVKTKLQQTYCFCYTQAPSTYGLAPVPASGEFTAEVGERSETVSTKGN